ncbi:Uncharacterised protein [Actinobacillus equuli]|nr:Uncharacterised protein [Actinobacillus equuli]
MELINKIKKHLADTNTSQAKLAKKQGLMQAHYQPTSTVTIKAILQFRSEIDRLFEKKKYKLVNLWKLQLLSKPQPLAKSLKRLSLLKSQIVWQRFTECRA